MSTISSSTTSSTAYKVAADTTGTLVLQTGATPTTAVTIDGSQNVGVGVTPSAWGSSFKALDISTYAAVGGTTASSFLSANIYNDNTNWKYKQSAAASVYYQSGGIHQWYNAPSGTAGATATLTQAMTLDASGNLLVGSTTATGGRFVVECNGGFNTAGANLWKNGAFNGRGSFGGPLSFINTGGSSDGFCFYLTGSPSTLNLQFGANGGSLSAGVTLASTGTSWAAFSDERLKTAITPFENAAEKVCSLRAGTGRFLTDDEGFSRSFLVAQDVQAVLPEAVDVGQDEQNLLSLRYQDVIPLLVAAIKEQQALITQLQADVAALKGA
jgi:Chaperone of endosialidase